MDQTTLWFPEGMDLGTTALSVVVAVAMGVAAAPTLAANAPPVLLAGPQMDQLTASAAGFYPATPFQPGQAHVGTPAAGIDDGADGANGRSASGPTSAPVSDAISSGSQVARSDSGRVTSGTLSRSVTSTGPGTTATSSATASGSGPSSVFVSSMTGTSANASLMPSSIMPPALAMPSMASTVPTPAVAGR